MAVAIELWQRYIDLLDEMMFIEVELEEKTTISINGVSMQIDIEQIGDWIYHGNQEPRE